MFRPCVNPSPFRIQNLNVTVWWGAVTSVVHAEPAGAILADGHEALCVCPLDYEVLAEAIPNSLTSPGNLWLAGRIPFDRHTTRNIQAPERSRRPHRSQGYDPLAAKEYRRLVHPGGLTGELVTTPVAPVVQERVRFSIRIEVVLAIAHHFGKRVHYAKGGVLRTIDGIHSSLRKAQIESV